MKLARILCRFGWHNYTQWRRKARSAAGSAQFRKCKRCGKQDESRFGWAPPRPPPPRPAERVVEPQPASEK